MQRSSEFGNSNFELKSLSNKASFDRVRCTTMTTVSRRTNLELLTLRHRQSCPLITGQRPINDKSTLVNGVDQISCIESEFQDHCRACFDALNPKPISDHQNKILVKITFFETNNSVQNYTFAPKTQNHQQTCFDAKS